MSRTGTTTTIAEGLSLSSVNLDAYAVSFWAVKGQDRGIQINYVNADGSTAPFLRFDVDDDALDAWPDGTAFQSGDSVQISVTVEDAAEMRVRFAPAGLDFAAAEPAQLQMWYTGAQGDLNSDATVNTVDTNIEVTLLGLWTRQAATDPWVSLPAQHSAGYDWFKSPIDHFSSYAISW